jgi:uncharacterized protein YbbC (DUF1343 family)
MFGKYAGEVCRGVQLHVTDRDGFAAVATALSMLRLLRELYPVEFCWRRPDGDGRYFVDLLWGSGDLRSAIDSDRDPAVLLADAPKDATWAGSLLLYE